MYLPEEHAFEDYELLEWSIWSQLRNAVDFWNETYATFWALNGDERPDYLPPVDSANVAPQHAMAPRLLGMARALSVAWPGTDAKALPVFTEAQQKFLREALRDLGKSPVVRDRVALDVAYDTLRRLADAEKRVVRLVSLVHGRGLSADASVYVHRATDLYIHGFEVEAVILCRSALDAALADRCREYFDQDEVTPTLEKLLDIAGRNEVLIGWEAVPAGSRTKRKWLARSDSALWRADQIRALGNHMIHGIPDFGAGNPTKLKDAFEVIRELSFVLGCLFPAPSFE